MMRNRAWHGHPPGRRGFPYENLFLSTNIHKFLGVVFLVSAGWCKFVDSLMG
jgi:hypothetical protein